MRVGKRHAEQADISNQQAFIKKNNKTCQVEVEEINQERGI